MIPDHHPREAVRSDVYTTDLCEGMGGRGSNELFVRSAGAVLRPRLAHALELAALEPGLRVLDIGCGRGEILIKSAQAGARLAVGVDYAAAPLQLARRNIEQMQMPTRSPALGLARTDAKALPFSSASFDRVFMLDIVEHLHEWELQKVWIEVRRVLAPGGFLLVHTLPNRWAVDYGYQLARLVLRALPRRPPDMRDVFHVNEQSVLSLSRSLACGGFTAHVWLEDLMLAQADWARRTGVVGEATAARVYATLQRPLFRILYRLATRWPTRLLMATDLFAVAWKPGAARAPAPRLPRAYPERLLRLIAGH